VAILAICARCSVVNLAATIAPPLKLANKLAFDIPRQRLHYYNEGRPFVRQAYFVGDDPYDALKRALKAEIDETAWAELNSTISRPFAKPKHGRICVKVINHFGDEVQKVFFI